MPNQPPAHAGSILLLAALALSAVACASDDESGGSGGTTLPDGCDALIAPSDNDVQTLQGALIDAETGDTICVQAGTYTFDKIVTLEGTSGITIKGIGASRDDAVFDFKNQTSGDDALTVQADHFTIENLTIKDPPGDGVKVTNSNFPTFRNVRAYYSTGAVATNGAYALYPAECTNVLIEGCEVEGSSDAAIYLGQSTTGIVRNNKAHDCVIGIEAENSEDVEIHDNEAWNNTTGFLIVNLPDLPHKGIRRINVHDNFSHENDHENFGADFAAGLPPGAGFTIMAADNVELWNNTIENNSGTGMLIVSWPVFAAVGGLSTTDPDYDQYTTAVYIHDNTFSGNGQNPHGGLEIIKGAGQTLEDIVWDGDLDPNADPATADQRRICIQNNGSATFRDFQFSAVPSGIGDLTVQTTDLAPHDCSYPALSPITLPAQ
jgi:parallel beta-helix repeat protein